MKYMDLLRHESTQWGIGPDVALQILVANPSSQPIMRTRDLGASLVCACSHMVWCELLYSSARQQPQVSISYHLGWSWCPWVTQGEISPCEMDRNIPSKSWGYFQLLCWYGCGLCSMKIEWYCSAKSVVKHQQTSARWKFTHCLLVQSWNPCLHGFWMQSRQEGMVPQPWCLCCLYHFYDWCQLGCFLLPRAWILKIDQISVDL